MNAADLSSYVKRMAEKINNLCTRSGFFDPIGYAISIPRNTSEQDIETVEKELVALRWSFEKATSSHGVYFVLFPMGK